jgi:predicted TIM-barrel fold metal-dependent hydrolase
MANSFTFIDAHIHLWDLGHLYYGWLTDQYSPDHVIGNYTSICRDQLIEDFIRDIGSVNVLKAVHIQAAVGEKNPVAETKWIQKVSDQQHIKLGIIGYSDLTDRACPAELDAHGQYPNFRGVRMLARPGLFEDRSFLAGMEHIRERDLIFDVDADWPVFHQVLSIAKSFPTIQFVLGHAGFPKQLDRDYFEHWQKGMSILAQAPNIACKISGIGMICHSANVATLRPWVMHCIEAFGTDRAMFATNWPVERLYSDYETLITAYRTVTEHFTEHERARLFRDNAEAIYRL